MNFAKTAHSYFLLNLFQTIWIPHPSNPQNNTDAGT